MSRDDFVFFSELALEINNMRCNMFVYIYFHVCILSIFSAVCVPVLLVCVPLPALSCFAQVCHFLIPQWGAPGLGQVLNISCASTSREWGLLVLMPLSLGFCSVVFQLSVFFGCSDLLSSFKNTFCGWFLSVIKFCSSHRDRTFSNLVFFFPTNWIVSHYELNSHAVVQQRAAYYGAPIVKLSMLK